MLEREYFSHSGVVVTNKRFVVNGETYSINNITKIEPSAIETKHGFPSVCMIIGLPLLVFGKGLLTFAGWFAVVIGILSWLTAKTKYSLAIHTADGRHEVLTSEDKQDIDNVVSALNRSISH